jgi:hypothetical protein
MLQASKTTFSRSCAARRSSRCCTKFVCARRQEITFRPEEPAMWVAWLLYSFMLFRCHVEKGLGRIRVRFRVSIVARSFLSVSVSLSLRILSISTHMHAPRAAKTRPDLCYLTRQRKHQHTLENIRIRQCRVISYFIIASFLLCLLLFSGFISSSLSLSSHY